MTSPSSLISYAQNAEDVMLWRALKDVQRGFYIDIGAWWPDGDNVTRLFYGNGWHGINIEPNPTPFAALEEGRARDTNLNFAIGAETKEMVLHTVEAEGSGLSTGRVDFLKTLTDAGWQHHQTRVLQTTLADIWAKYVPVDQPVHFLKIDVEGMEKAVVVGNDWTKNRPWIVLIEATLPNSQIECHHEWEPTLLAANYIFAYADGLNRFYVASEQISLKEAFKYPPNIFDNYVHHTVRDLREHVTSLEEEHRQLVNHNDSVQAQLKTMKSEFDGVQRELDAVEKENRRLNIEARNNIDEFNRLTRSLIIEHDTMVWELMRRHRTIFLYRGIKGRLRQAGRRFSSYLRKLRGRDPNWADVETIRQSIFFDAGWYLREYPDVASNGWDAAEHYFLCGAREGRDPSAWFSTKRYYETYPECTIHTNPLVHLWQRLAP